jgi:hypothetical protein
MQDGLPAFANSTRTLWVSGHGHEGSIAHCAGVVLIQFWLKVFRPSLSLALTTRCNVGLQEMGNVLVAALDDIHFFWQKWGTAIEQQPSFQYAMLQGTGTAAI